jgi:hypothetical protein
LPTGQTLNRYSVFAGVFSNTRKRRRGATSCCEEVRTQITLPTAISAAIWPLFDKIQWEMLPNIFKVLIRYLGTPRNSQDRQGPSRIQSLDGYEVSWKDIEVYRWSIKLFKIVYK